MDIISHRVVNFDDFNIEVDFLVLHYTALDLSQTLKRFNHPQSKVSSHFVINDDGSIYECVPALELLKNSNQKQRPKKAWHCGQSSYAGKENFNDFSIGIELIHPNGNFFQYTKKQYQSLIWLTQKLIERYQKLNHPNQIVGHENIAANRGKVDPGFVFDWVYFLKSLFNHFDEKQINQIAKNRTTINQKMVENLNDLFQDQECKLSLKSPFWAYFNNWLEYSQREQNRKILN